MSDKGAIRLEVEDLQLALDEDDTYVVCVTLPPGFVTEKVETFAHLELSRADSKLLNPRNPSVVLGNGTDEGVIRIIASKVPEEKRDISEYPNALVVGQ